MQMAAVRFSLGLLLVASVFMACHCQLDVSAELEQLHCSPMKRETSLAFLKLYVPKQVDNLVSEKMSDDMVNLVRCHVLHKCVKQNFFFRSFKIGTSECMKVLTQDFGRKMLMDMNFPSY